MLDYKKSLLFSEVRRASKKLVKKKLVRASERSLGVRGCHSKVPCGALSYRVLFFLTRIVDIAVDCSSLSDVNTSH